MLIGGQLSCKDLKRQRPRDKNRATAQGRGPQKSSVRKAGVEGVGKIVGRQKRAKPFPFMETIFSKNKQFRCRATRELPAHPQGMSGCWGEGCPAARAVAREVMGVPEGSKRGCLEAAKGRDNQGLSLTHPPNPGVQPGSFCPKPFA